VLEPGSLFRWTPNGTGARYQWAFAVENPAPDLTGAEGLNFTPDFWSRVFTTAVTYGVVNVSNLDIQLDDAFHRTQRTSINLMWNPVPFTDIVLELLAGTRVNKNGERASSSQIQASPCAAQTPRCALNWT
jgi:hypothetical protein